MCVGVSVYVRSIETSPEQDSRLLLTTTTGKSDTNNVAMHTHMYTPTSDDATPATGSFLCTIT